MVRRSRSDERKRLNKNQIKIELSRTCRTFANILRKGTANFIIGFCSCRKLTIYKYNGCEFENSGNVCYRVCWCLLSFQQCKARKRRSSTEHILLTLATPGNILNILLSTLLHLFQSSARIHLGLPLLLLHQPPLKHLLLLPLLHLHQPVLPLVVQLKRHLRQLLNKRVIEILKQSVGRVTTTNNCK